MAEGLVSFTMEGILTKVVLLAAQEVSLARGFEGELTRLSESFSIVRTRLRDAEERQVRDEAVRLWLKKLREVALDAEDVLDEFDYEMLRCEAELHNRLKKKVRNFLSLCNPIAFRFKMAHEVKNINLSLNDLKNEATALGLQVSRVDPTPQFNQIRETASIVDDSKVVGREEDASNIVKTMVDLGNQEVLSVISIVGMAGLGKTTLAQLVYKDDEIKSYFDARIWVCVSDQDFDTRRILSQSLESLNPSKGKMENMNAILENLQKELEGKRYLLVLDDVWKEEQGKWDSLMSRLSLINTTKGNKIIVTTRSDRVATVVETLPSYHLGKLSEEECWSVFKDRAFANGGVPMTPDLEAIGREIVKKCEGVPLVAKLLGSMMRYKNEKNEWMSIQNSNIWELPEEQNGILPALKLSFNHLPSPSLKQCFAYCSLFPKESKIDKNNLIQLWIAQGLIGPSQEGNFEMEDLGDGYFDVLLANSFFEAPEMDEYGNIKFCKLHSLVHELAQLVLKFECLTLEPKKVNDKLRIPHLSLISTGEILPDISDESAGKLLTLFSKGNTFADTLSKFKGLRVLNLAGAGIEELPISIGKLTSLRYLDVSQTRIKALPQSISNLYKLPTLRLMNCENLQEFPKDLKSLISLRHICIEHNIFKKILSQMAPLKSKKMPIGMFQLTRLQTLPYFAVGQERGGGIEELARLKKLRGKLMIDNLENVRDGEEAKKANLMGKTAIYKLGFTWDGIREDDNNDEEVLEGLQPHPNLKSLTIQNFGGNKFPSWMMMMSINSINVSLPLNKLVKIKLFDCNKCTQIPMLGRLPLLRVLEIRGFDNVKSIGIDFYSDGNDGACGSSGGESELRASFPALKRLAFGSMRNLGEWMAPAAGVVFPCLEDLSLDYCPLLTTTPSHFSRLRKLEIRHMNNSVLENLSSNLTTLTSLSIRGVSALTSLPEGLLENNRNLESLEIWYCRTLTHITLDVSGYCASLRSLVIGWCEKLSCLPDGLQTLVSLERLSISQCPNLESIPNIQGLTSLRTLEIVGCRRLKSLPNALESWKSLKDLTIRFCPNVKSVPEDLGELRYFWSLNKPNLASLSSLRELYREKSNSLPEGLHSLHCLNRLKTSPGSSILSTIRRICNNLKF